MIMSSEVPRGPSQPTGKAVTATIEQVRTLTSAEIEQAARMLAHTYDESPLFCSAFPLPERRMKAAHAIFKAVLRDGLRYGRVFVARDTEIVGALIVYLPGSYPMTTLRKLRLLPQYAQVAVADISGLIKIIRAQDTLLSLHPPGPYLYGCFIGVARGRQGDAVGTGIAKQFIKEADTMHLPMYGEAQELHIVKWYERLGGRIVREGVPLYEGGPTTWTLWRDAVGPPAK
jgi:hypothetical protein